MPGLQSISGGAPIRASIFFVFCAGLFAPLTIGAGQQLWAQKAGHDLSPTKDFSKAEPGEAFPGGAATSRKSTQNKNAFSHSSHGMPFEQELNFKIGNGIFRKLWVSSPASTKTSDGLGPLFNARSCQRCHLKDGRGRPPQAGSIDDKSATMLLRLSIPPQNKKQKLLFESRIINSVPDPTYGRQLQDFAIQGHKAEGQIHITYKEDVITLHDGEKISLRKPSIAVKKLAYGPLHKDIQISARVAPHMVGLGLLERVPAIQIMRHADPQDKNNDGISGKPNITWSPNYKHLELGRFGWKAGIPSLKDQTAAAFLGDMGLSTALHPEYYGDCTKAQLACRAAPHGAADDKTGEEETKPLKGTASLPSQPKAQNKKPKQVEVSTQLLNLVTFYTQNLAVPARRNANDPQVLKGKEMFYKSGCIACHRPKLRTGPAKPIYKGQDYLANQLIWPYTDLLLHDMGPGLADKSPEGRASGQEWRTPPLWGIGLFPVVNGHSFYLHDGRARNLKEAILWHGGEAEKAKQNFMALQKNERDALIAFVKSL